MQRRSEISPKNSRLCWPISVLTTDLFPVAVKRWQKGNQPEQTGQDARGDQFQADGDVTRQRELGRKLSIRLHSDAIFLSTLIRRAFASYRDWVTIPLARPRLLPSTGKHGSCRANSIIKPTVRVRRVRRGLAISARNGRSFMKLSAPIYRLKRNARLLSRERNIPLNQASTRSPGKRAAKAGACSPPGFRQKRRPPGCSVN